MVTSNSKIALITGANKGLGKETARQLGERGYTVILGSRNEQAGSAVADELKSAGIDAYTVRLEVTNSDDIANAAAYIDSTFGKLDVLVNNAGIALEWDGTGTDPDKIRRTLDVNVVAPYAITEALIPLLSKSDDARVVNQSSMLGSMATADDMWDQVKGFMAVGYSTSKAALNMLTLIQSKSLADKGIAVAATHPGWVKTDMGGEAAPLEVEEGASTAVDLVTMDRAIFPHGHLYHMGERMAW